MKRKYKILVEVATEEQRDAVLVALEMAEQEGEIDFPFSVTIEEPPL